MSKDHTGKEEPTMQTPNEQMDKEIEGILRRLRAGLNREIEQDVSEAHRQLKRLVLEGRKVTGETSDGYHTFNELYEFRMLYNAAFFNNAYWYGDGSVPTKSKRHSDGELCFGGGWFVVTAQLPTGQITNHYEMKDWDLFHIPELERAPEWDGHTPQDVAKRLRAALTAELGELGEKDG